MLLKNVRFQALYGHYGVHSGSKGACRGFLAQEKQEAHCSKAAHALVVTGKLVNDGSGLCIFSYDGWHHVLVYILVDCIASRF